jgi:hypothetical protein
MFTPLGHFNPSAVADPKIVAAAKAFLATLPYDPQKGDLTRLYLHWTVAGMGCDFDDYNVEAKVEQEAWLFKLEHNPQDEIPGFDSNPEIAGTWHRNTGSIAIAITGMDGATEEDFGPDGVTWSGLQWLCGGAAALCVKYGIDANGTVPAPGSNHLDNNNSNVNTTGEHNILTHGEVAVLDFYPSERWDLGSFVPLPDGVSLTPEMRSQCGDALRQLIRTYKLAILA